MQAASDPVPAPGHNQHDTAWALGSQSLCLSLGSGVSILAPGAQSLRLSLGSGVLGPGPRAHNAYACPLVPAPPDPGPADNR
ncbi:hypothetical protein COHCIP112018_03462 [Cohnella sp. JJ-181]|nr:hypothetical protein COHCIP112018_03462 [Cohnella sp. JJ-181]